jgi:hypothetical protein
MSLKPPELLHGTVSRAAQNDRCSVGAPEDVLGARKALDLLAHHLDAAVVGRIELCRASARQPLQIHALHSGARRFPTPHHPTAWLARTHLKHVVAEAVTVDPTCHRQDRARLARARRAVEEQVRQAVCLNEALDWSVA